MANMRIWHLSADSDNFNNIVPVNESNWSKFEFDGTWIQNDWNPVEVKTLKEIQYSDFLALVPGVPVFSKKALKHLAELINESVEVLPLVHNKEKLFAINVIKVLDCVDYDKSEYKKFTSSNRIMRFVRYEFIKEKLMNTHIFKIKDEPSKRPFVSDTFRNRVLEYGLKGFEFEEVWSD